MAAAIEYRLPAFPVVRQDAPREQELKWGGVRVERGAPTARHRDVLDAVLAVGQRAIDRAGQMHVVFDLVEVQKILGAKTDWRGIRKLLLDLVGTVISLHHPGHDWPPAFPILTFVGDATSDAPRKPHEFKAKMKRITLSAGATAMLLAEARVCLNRATVAEVLALKHQVSRAVARWCLSHSNDQCHPLADVLAAVGAALPGEPISGRKARRGVHERVHALRDDAAALQRLGIEIEGETIRYRRNREVFIDAGGVEALTPAVEALTPVSKGNIYKGTLGGV